MNQGHPNKKSSFKDGIKLKHKNWSDMDLLSGVWDPLKPRSGATWNLSQETVHCANQALGCKQEGRQHNLCLSRNTLTRNVQYSTQKHPMGSCEARFPWKEIRNSGRGWPHKILYNHFVNPRIPRCLLLEKTREFWKGCCQARFPWKKMRDPGAVGCST